MVWIAGYNPLAMKATTVPAIVLTLLLTGCGRYLPLTTPPAPLQSATPSPPTATPEPLAAMVNGEAIPLQAFEDELMRFEAAQLAAGIDLATLEAYPEGVLAAMIDLKLLAQGALGQGLGVSEAEIDRRLGEIAAGFDDAAGFTDWLTSGGYTAETFRSALEEQVLAANMVEEIISGMPAQVEQVHARHILVSTLAEAEQIQASLASGSDFATLANQVSQDASTRPVGGDLGWFPKGYLVVPEVDEAAFALERGGISGIVESSLGYHLVQTIERGSHPPDANVERWLREQAVENWLAERRGVSEIEVFITP